LVARGSPDFVVRGSPDPAPFVVRGSPDPAPLLCAGLPTPHPGDRRSRGRMSPDPAPFVVRGSPDPAPLLCAGLPTPHPGDRRSRGRMSPDPAPRGPKVSRTDGLETKPRDFTRDFQFCPANVLLRGDLTVGLYVGVGDPRRASFHPRRARGCAWVSRPRTAVVRGSPDPAPRGPKVSRTDVSRPRTPGV
jgi:hypothetical protein